MGHVAPVTNYKYIYPFQPQKHVFLHFIVIASASADKKSGERLAPNSEVVNLKYFSFEVAFIILSYVLHTK